MRRDYEGGGGETVLYTPYAYRIAMKTRVIKGKFIGLPAPPLRSCSFSTDQMYNTFCRRMRAVNMQYSLSGFVTRAEFKLFTLVEGRSGRTNLCQIYRRAGLCPPPPIQP